MALLCPDLLFGSKLEGALRAAGHEVALVGDAGSAPGSDVLVVDLTSDAEARIDAAAGVRGVPRLAFYAHVQQEVRRRAEAAGLERVVPRSRMARDAATLVEGLVA